MINYNLTFKKILKYIPTYIFSQAISVFIIIFFNLGEIIKLIQDGSLGTEGQYLFVNNYYRNIPIALITTFLVLYFYHKWQVKNNITLGAEFKLKRFKSTKIFLYGFLIGALMIITEVIINLAINNYSLGSINTNPLLFLNLIGVGLIPAVAEEVFNRGVLFRFFEQKFNPVVAIFLSSLFFAIPHFLSQDIVSIISILFGIGLVFTAAYIASGRNLWFTIGLHTAHNFIMNAVFNLPYGNQSSALFQAKIVNTENIHYILVTTLFEFIVFLLLIVYSKKKNLINLPTN